MSLELRRGLMGKVGIPKDAIIVAERSENEAALMDVIYAKGWSASPKYMRKSEAEKVTDIGAAFQSNTAITDFSAFKYFTSVTSIGERAFFNCTNLVLTSLPNGLKSISNAAFYNCTKLALTELPSGVTSIGLQAFSNCTNLVLTSLPNGLKSITQQAFFNCTKLALTELPSGVTSIGNGAFLGCSKITNIRILNTTSKITSGTNMFTSNPTIEVPSALLADYQADANWSKLNLVAY